MRPSVRSVVDLTPSQKGAVAEAAVTAAAVSMGVLVLRPVCEGGRYDLAFDLEPEVIRVQVKCARKQAGVLTVSLRTNRLTPRGYRARSGLPPARADEEQPGSGDQVGGRLRA